MKRIASRFKLYDSELGVDIQQIRHVSSAVFGNEKVVEVVLALADERGVATAQQVSKRTGIDHPMVRGVLLRLVTAGVLSTLPRANSRAPQYYEVKREDLLWPALHSLAEAVASLHRTQPTSAGEPERSEGVKPDA